MRIQLTLNHGTVISATLADHRTAEDFVAMLPLTLTLHDLFRREKFGPLPGPVSGRGAREQAYAVGDIVCWTAGPDLAILHRQDGQPLRGGFELLGRLDFGAELFAVPGPIDVTIALAAPAHAGLTTAGCPAPAAAEGARATT
ncbi:MULTISPECIES: cyclophilin-like fold protein [unclassified Variovorax]|uniref:cyclophilin-like fold protein n=1 Tax=unclassified Variovorax TaxID=663243 RepID=UPI0025764321|nr:MULTISPECIES: cyclophilin-like fold protein [unclassified Variovorax]MDM0090155.1 cyclophilin-like fold protein [Variovorax sp. J22G40]MDM0148179.1 cyclophilin-like fold protein [Variovorax sp. J2P1-31]